jgi:hypothetical protein
VGGVGQLSLGEVSGLDADRDLAGVEVAGHRGDMETMTIGDGLDGQSLAVLSHEDIDLVVGGTDLTLEETGSWEWWLVSLRG